MAYRPAMRRVEGEKRSEEWEREEGVSGKWLTQAVRGETPPGRAEGRVTSNHHHPLAPPFVLRLKILHTAEASFLSRKARPVGVGRSQTLSERVRGPRGGGELAAGVLRPLQLFSFLSFFLSPVSR